MESPESTGHRVHDAEVGVLAWIDRDITGPLTGAVIAVTEEQRPGQA